MSFLICGLISCIAMITLPIIAQIFCKSKLGTKVSMLRAFSLCAIIAIFIYLLPYNIAEYRQYYVDIIMTALQTMKVFLNSGNSDLFADALLRVDGFGWGLKLPYWIYTALLILLAPMLTFGNVLSLFGQFFENLRFDTAKLTHRICYMSELNDCSLTLANSIMSLKEQPEDGEKKRGKRVIVFADVDDKVSVDIRASAKKIKAILLKRSVTDEEVFKLKKPAEIYFCGSDENENISRAAALTKYLDDNTKNALDVPEKGSNGLVFHSQVRAVRIYAFAGGRANGCILDSVKFDKQFHTEQLPGFFSVSDLVYLPRDFGLRRIDITQRYIWKEIADMDLFPKDTDKVSILIVGAGYYGLEFLKTLSWFCHFKGKQLDINVVDSIPDIKARIERNCPGLLGIGELIRDYSLNLYPNVELSDTDNFYKLLTKSEDLMRTTHVIVALGDDEFNTETALYIREMFCRAASLNAEGGAQKTCAAPKIFAMLYDDHYNDYYSTTDRKLIDHKKTPYDIDFIGGLKPKYSIDILNDAELEEAGHKKHLHWALADGLDKVIRENIGKIKECAEKFSARERALLKLFLDPKDDSRNDLISYIEGLGDTDADRGEMLEKARSITALAELLDSIIYKISDENFADKKYIEYTKMVFEQVKKFENTN